MARYGIKLYGPTHDATNVYFSVPARQIGWFRRLSGDGKSLLHANPRPAHCGRVFCAHIS